MTVEDDDERGVELSTMAVTMPEGTGRTYTVVLKSQPSGPVTVTPSAAGSPDVTVSGALTFTAATWNRAQTVTVSATEDADAENDAATVSHAVSGGGYGSVTAAEVAVTVSDDDERGVELSTMAADGAGGDRPDLYGGAQVAADWPGDGAPVGGGQRGRDGERCVDVHRGDLEPGADGDGVGRPRMPTRRPTRRRCRTRCPAAATASVTSSRRCA